MADFNRQIVEALALEPSRLAALALFERFTSEERGPSSMQELIEMQPEIEAALVEIEQVEREMRGMVQRCLELKPTAARRVPRGF